jgi:hypothetical protein
MREGYQNRLAGRKSEQAGEMDKKKGGMGFV